METNQALPTCTDIESRLARAHDIATAAIHTLRLALAAAPPGRSMALVDRVDDFFALLEAFDATVIQARAAASVGEARELAEDAYVLAVAARREAGLRASAMMRG